jgi:Ca-activated chloride channel family protein
MRFGDAQLLWLAVLAPLLALFFAWALWRKAARLRRFADPEMLRRLTAGTSLPRQILKMLLLMGAVLFLALALARPQWGSKMELVQRKGLDIVIAVDVSLSMLAEDIRPNRLARSKQEIQRFVERLEGDRAALVAFAGDAFLQCPLTSDYAAFRIFLDVLDPGLIEAPGTDLARAMETAIKAFPPGEGKQRVMVLLTDGEDHGGRALKVAEAAAEQGVIIYTVGIGSVTGVPIPIGDGSGSRAYKRDSRGEIVSTRLAPELLSQIALATGGEFYHAEPGRFELLDVLKKINAMEKRTLDSQRLSRFEERFQLALAAALLLLVLEALISDRRRRKAAWSGRFS